MPIIELIQPQNDITISVLAPKQRDFLDNRDFSNLRASDDELVDWLGLKQDDTGDNSIPRPIIFTWNKIPATSLNYVLEIATDPDFQDVVRQIKTRNTRQAVWNLPQGQAYYWKVYSEGLMNVSETRMFSTEPDVPRWLFVGGLTNVRDCGGWMTSSGVRIKQGLLYRGSEMDRHHAITPLGRIAIKDDLKLKTDLDIRGDTEIPIDYVPPLENDGVGWINIPIAPYADIGQPKEKLQYKKLFEFLSTPEIYPAYCHCWGGADRTGTVCLLLNAILGVKDQDLILDYELTSCAIYGARKRNFKLFTELLDLLDQYASKDEPLETKATNFLLDAGISDETIQNIKSIFLE